MLAATVSLLSCLVLAGDVHVVDGAGGGDFTQIQPAVDAAADGDIVLVSSGQYGFVEILNKGVSIVADTGATVVVSGISVRGTLVHHEVVLSGLESRGVKTESTLRHALELVIARGPVRVEDCELLGPDGFVPDELGTYGNRGEAAVRVVQALDLAFARCTLRGGAGQPDYLCQPDTCAGGDGLDMRGGSVSLHDCELYGGAGADNFSWDLSHGGNGGHGARVRDDAPLPAFVYASGSNLMGGTGGDGALCLDIGGDGGHGLWLDGASKEGQLLDNDLQGASGGCGAGGGAMGAGLHLTGGATANLIGGDRRGLDGEVPATSGGTIALTFEGRPGDRVWWLSHTQPGFRFAAHVNGVFLLRTPGLQRVEFAGVVPPSGTLTVSFSVPVLPTGVEGQPLFTQALFEDPTTRRWLSGPLSLVVLDPLF